MTKTQAQRWFGWFAVFVLAYNLPVILWGAYVRASFSGDGCGAHWPTCNGAFVPQKMALPMKIEYAHRAMTGLDTALVLALMAAAWLLFPKRHAVRRYAAFSLLFLVIEALLGAGLVLFRYVAHDVSAGRAVYLSAHLVNTMLLLGALAITAWLAVRERDHFRLTDFSSRPVIALAITIFVSVTGTIAALGDTLFPAASLRAGMQQDFSASSDAFLQLRFLHPVMAVAGALYVLWLAWSILRSEPDGTRARTAAQRLLTLILVQLAIGVMNLSLLAPIWAQLVHLLVADLVWISVVLLAAETAGMETRRVQAQYATARSH